MPARERTPLNAPGPFFTAKDQCITCGAPEAEALDLMAFDVERGSCHFRRQPGTPDAVRRAIRAVCVACCDGVEYDGDDPAILAELQRQAPDRSALPRPPRQRRQPWACP